MLRQPERVPDYGPDGEVHGEVFKNGGVRDVDVVKAAYPEAGRFSLKIKLLICIF